MKNVEIVSEYFDVEVKLSTRMSENSTPQVENVLFHLLDIR
jgi:hypothetical protein